MTENYPRRFWWVVLVAVPIALAAIDKLPSLASGTGGADAAETFNLGGAQFGGHVTMVGTQVLLSQVTDAATRTEVEASVERAVALARKGFAEDAIELFEQVAARTSSPAAYNNLGALLATSGRNAEAEAAYKEAIVLDPADDTVSANLARLQAGSGDLDGALRTLQGARETGAVEKLRSEIARRLEDGSVEAEPNDDILSPNRFPLSTPAQGTIHGDSDADFFTIQAPDPPRDWLEVRLTNGGTTLQPRILVWNADKSFHSASQLYPTAGQDVTHWFTAAPGSKHFVSVVGREGSSGRYQIEVVPLERFDAYEPNDRIPDARALGAAATLSANIMEPSDVDFYRFRSVSAQTPVRLTNLSESLKPQIHLWADDKQHLWGTTGYTAGQDVRSTLATEPGRVYYLSVRGYEGQGDYELSIGGEEVAGR